MGKNKIAIGIKILAVIVLIIGLISTFKMMSYMSMGEDLGFITLCSSLITPLTLSGVLFGVGEMISKLHSIAEHTSDTNYKVSRALATKSKQTTNIEFEND